MCVCVFVCVTLLLLLHVCAYVCAHAWSDEQGREAFCAKGRLCATWCFVAVHVCKLRFCLLAMTMCWWRWTFLLSIISGTPANGKVLLIVHSYLPASMHLIIPVPAWMGEQMEPCSWYFTAACQYPCTWLSQCLLDWLRNWNRTPDSSYLLASTCASGFFSACANGQDVHENMLYQDVHENVLYQDVRHDVLYQAVH